ncbi:glycosyltransferase [Ensifer canadensis]
MAGKAPRRRVLCVRPTLNPDAGPLLRRISNEWVDALALHCHVDTIDQDFDFEQTCKKLKPDFVVFDAVHWVRPQRLNIANIDAFPEIPRVLYLNCDPHDPMRPLLFGMLETYGIETIFCGIEHLQHMPELERFTCHLLPLFIDSKIFRDYAVEKTIPVTIFSGHLFPAFYPWRAKVTQEIQHFLPTLVYTHPGYQSGTPAPFEVRDEKYARLISQSYFSIADTTRLDYVVRKHLEIPAAGAILVAPDSEVVKRYGFVDLENCILGSGEELYAKIVAVSSKPDVYNRIKKSGYRLIQDNFTREKWTYLLDWYECRMARKPGEMTQQTKQFGRFRNVPAHPDTPAIADFSLHDNPMSAILRDARDAVLTGDDLGQAQATLTDACQWIGHIAEPPFMLGMLALLQGQLEDAIVLFTRRGNAQGRLNPNMGRLDPCEIAWLLLLSALLNDADLREMMMRQAETVPHVSIRRAMWLISGPVQCIDFEKAGLEGPLPGDCLSIHWLGQEDFPQWLALMERILNGCGLPDQAGMIRVLADGLSGIASAKAIAI